MQVKKDLPIFYKNGDYSPTIPEELRACIPPSGPVKEYMDFMTQLIPWAQPIFHLCCAIAFTSYHLCLSGAGSSFRILFLIVAPPGSGKGSALDGMSKCNDLYAIREEDQSEFSPLRTLKIEEGATPQGVRDALQLEDTLGGDFRRHVARLIICDEFGELLGTRSKSNWSPFILNLADGRLPNDITRGAQKALKSEQGRVQKYYPPAISGVLSTPASTLELALDRRVITGGLLSRFGLVTSRYAQPTFSRFERIPEASDFINSFAERRNLWSYNNRKLHGAFKIDGKGGGDIQWTQDNKTAMAGDNLLWDPESLTFLEGLYPELTRRYDTQDQDNLVMSGKVRLPTLLRTIAQIYAVSDTGYKTFGENHTVDMQEHHAHAAVNTVRLIERNLHAVGVALGSSSDALLIEKIENIFQKRGGAGVQISLRDLQRNYFKDASSKELAVALGTLKAMGNITEAETASGTSKGAMYQWHKGFDNDG